MSTPIFPDLPGLAWEATRDQKWEGLVVQTSASQLEQRFQQQSLPRSEWTLKVNYLKMAASFQNLQTLWGFIGARGGGLNSFFLRDQDDSGVRGQFIATGDGTTTAFQLQRTWGSYSEPILGLDTRGSATYGPYTRPATITQQAYVNGSPVTATFASETGIMTLATASGTSGQFITADFSYLWRVRFSDPATSFDRLWSQVYECKTLKAIQVRV
jgi:uncharacterized protein (TIGR02217 family)